MSKFSRKKEVEKTPEEILRETVYEGYVKSHGTPITRREMLASGLIPFAATTFMPSWLRLFANVGVAEAQEAIVCSTGSLQNLPAFVQFKGDGGFAIGANAVARAQGGESVKDFTKYMGGTPSTIQLTTEFKNKAEFLASSGFLAGMRSVVTPETFARSSFHIIPVRVGDDSGVQPLSITAAIEKAGNLGSKFKRLGTAGTSTGINAMDAFDTGLSTPPLQVRAESDLLGTLGVSGVLSSLSAGQKSKMFDAVKKMSDSQLKSISGLNGAETLKRLMHCANISNYELIANPGSLNISVLGNTQVSTLWGVTANTSTTDRNFIFSSLTYNAAMGNSGPVSMSIGGCDYHNGTRTTGDAVDNQIGVIIGRALQTFALLGKAGMICVCTDGAVQSSVSEVPGAPWQSDGGSTSAVYMICYEPTMTLNVKQTQIGWMEPGGISSNKFITGSAPGKAMAAVLANYLNLIDETNSVAKLDTITGSRFFTSVDLEQILVVNRKA